MKKAVCIVALVALAAAMSWAEEDRAKELSRVQSAGNVLKEIMDAPDKGIPAEILSSAECVAVVPSMLKGGFVFGARYGKGVATCRHGQSWSAPAPFRIEGGSWGLQIGGQAVDLVMLVMNQKGMQQLLQSKFKLGADASAAAGPVGRHVEGTTDWKMRAEVLTYSRSRGAFAGITLNGAVIKQDTDDTVALYGKDIPFGQLLSGRVPPPAGTQPFLTEVATYFRQAQAGEVAKSSTSTTNTGTGSAKTTAQTQAPAAGTTGSVSAGTGATAADANAGVNTQSSSTQTGTSGNIGASATTPSTGGNTGAAGTGGVAGTTTSTYPQGQSAQTGTTGTVGSNAGTASGSTSATATEQTPMQQQGTTAAPSSNASQDNADVKDQIQRALASEPGVSSGNLVINVTNDTVELSGSVPNQSERATIKRIVQQNAGNRKVDDSKLAVK
jgi:lipid-binding SYLF domain-containing protein/osmotically-inducible protein OsmY